MYKLANADKVVEDRGLIVEGPEGQLIALFRIEEEIYALDNECPHQGGPLGDGEIEDGVVTCPWHSWQFDICTGTCQNMPGDDATKVDIAIVDGIVYLVD